MKLQALLLLLLLLTPFIAAQKADTDWVIDPDFVPVSSEECGDKNNACLHASFTSMLASLKDPRLGDTDKIRDLIGKQLKKYSDQYPYPTATLLDSVIKVLLQIL